MSLNVSMLKMSYLWILVLISCAHIVDGNCGTYNDEEIIRRIDYALVVKLDAYPQLPILEINSIQESIMDRQFGTKTPLSIAMISSEKSGIRKILQLLQIAIFGNLDAKGIKTIDIKQAIQVYQNPSDVKTYLKEEIIHHVTKCPDRSFFVLENLDALSVDQVYLPVLDALLDPLSGRRASIGDGVQAVDCNNAIIILTFLSTKNDILEMNWEEILIQKWRTTDEHAFTPSALLGRISKGIVLNELSDIQQTQLDELQLEIPQYSLGDVRNSDFEFNAGFICSVYIFICLFIWISKNSNFDQ